MRRVFKLLSITIVFAILCENSIFATNTINKYALNVSTPLTAVQIAKENIANNAYSNLIASFYQEYIDSTSYDIITEMNTEILQHIAPLTSNNYTVNGLPAECYPEYYAGAYLNANYDLVIMVTEESALTKKTICDRAKETSVVFQKASYSYYELISCMEDIIRLWSSGDDRFQAVKCAFIDDFENCIVIGCSNVNDEYLSFLLENLPMSYLVTIIHCDDNVDKTVALESTTIDGHTILSKYPNIVVPNLDDWDVFSYGCKATKVVNGITKYGFITAGHAVSQGEYVFLSPPYAYSNHPLGVCITSIEQPSLGVDAAFVEIIDSNYLLSSVIPSSPYNNISNSPTTALQGDPIHKYGSETQTTDGHVAIASFTINVGGTYFYKDLVVTTYDADDGDSGGLVYYLDTTQQLAIPLGIHMMRISPSALQGWNMLPDLNPMAQDGFFRVYCKMGYVTSYLGVSLSN